MNKKLTLLSTAMLSATSLFAADKNPNIILILADDMRGTAMDFLGVETYTLPIWINWLPRVPSLRTLISWAEPPAQSVCRAVPC